MVHHFSIDHHLQSHTVRQLMAHGEQSFSALKPADVENSLFMYHTRKLITRGIIEKTEHGFQLTARGARWANKTDASIHVAELPRPMTQLIVIQDDCILLSERVDHMAKHLNRYMLPGTLHRFGETSRASAERVAGKLGLTLTSDCVGHTEVIIPSRQLHTIIDFYPATAPDPTYTFDDGLLQLRFVPIATVLAMPASEANALPQLVKALINNLPYEQTYVL